MSGPPKDRLKFWMHFVCAFFFFGGVSALFLIRFVDRAGLLICSLAWLAFTLTISTYLSWQGDKGWMDILGRSRHDRW